MDTTSRLRRLGTIAATLLVTSLLAGCAAPEPEPLPPAPPATAEVLDGLRTSYQAVRPEARLAAVGEVLPAEDFLSLIDAPESDFPVGTVVTIIDSTGATLAHGTVVRHLDGQAHVRFSVAGPRRPTTGDIGVRF